MKIRTDFVTNSSSSSFTCLRFDNPVLQQLLIEHNIEETPSRLEVSLSKPPATQNELLCRLVEQINKPDFTDAVNQDRDRINASFQRLEWGDGYDNWEGMPSGHEEIVSGSSRWGLYSQEAWFDEEYYDRYECEYAHECWAVGKGTLNIPAENDTLLFANARPEDWRRKEALSEKMQYVLQHIYFDPIELENKTFALNTYHPFDHTYYGCIDVDKKHRKNDIGEDGRIEFDTDERPNHLYSCLPDDIRIRLWLSCFGSTTRPYTSVTNADYYVVRLDEWAEEYIDLEVIQEAVAANVRIISEHQLWRTIFVDHKSELLPEAIAEALYDYKVYEYGEDVVDREAEWQAQQEAKRQQKKALKDAYLPLLEQVSFYDGTIDFYQKKFLVCRSPWSSAVENFDFNMAFLGSEYHYLDYVSPCDYPCDYIMLEDQPSDAFFEWSPERFYQMITAIKQGLEINACFVTSSAFCAAYDEEKKLVIHPF